MTWTSRRPWTSGWRMTSSWGDPAGQKRMIKRRANWPEAIISFQESYLLMEIKAYFVVYVSNEISLWPQQDVYPLEQPLIIHWVDLVAVQDWDRIASAVSQNLVATNPSRRSDPNHCQNPISLLWAVLAAVRRLPDMNLASCTVTTSLDLTLETVPRILGLIFSSI